MAYTPTTWVDGSAPDIDATNLNHLETGVQAAAATADAAVPKPASPASNDALVWNGSSWVNSKIADANVSATAAIAYSKLALTGSVVNADIASAAAIAASKLASYPSDGTKFLAGDGTWKASSSTTYRKTTAKDVNTTVAATDLLNGEITVGAGVLGTTGKLRGVLMGDALNNTGGGLGTPRLQILLGGTTLLDTGTAVTGSLGSSATREPWVVEFEILNLGSASSQFAWMRAMFSLDANRFTTGIGTYNATSQAFGEMAFGVTNGTTAVNTANACALVVNTINPSSSASYSIRLQGAVVEII